MWSRDEPGGMLIRIIADVAVEELDCAKRSQPAPTCLLPSILSSESQLSTEPRPRPAQPPILREKPGSFPSAQLKISVFVCPNNRTIIPASVRSPPPSRDRKGFACQCLRSACVHYLLYVGFQCSSNCTALTSVQPYSNVSPTVLH